MRNEEIDDGDIPNLYPADAIGLTLANPPHPPMVLCFGKSEPASVTASILTAQKAAWAAHLLYAVSRNENTPVDKLSWSKLTKALEMHFARSPHAKAQVPGADEAVAWNGRPFSFQLNDATTTNDQQIYLSEHYAPGAVEAFYVGPHGSMLWWAMGENGYCLRHVISRFSAFVGDLSESNDFFYGQEKWAAFCDPEFWIELVETLPIIALKVLAYHLSMHRAAKSLSQNGIVDALHDDGAALCIHHLGSFNLHGVIAIRLLSSLTVMSALSDIGVDAELFFRDDSDCAKPKFRPLTSSNVEDTSLGMHDEQELVVQRDRSHPILLTSKGLIWKPTGKLLFGEAVMLWKQDRSLRGLVGLANEREEHEKWLKELMAKSPKRKKTFLGYV